MAEITVSYKLKWPVDPKDGFSPRQETAVTVTIPDIDNGDVEAASKKLDGIVKGLVFESVGATGQVSADGSLQPVYVAPEPTQQQQTGGGGGTRTGGRKPPTKDWVEMLARQPKFVDPQTGTVYYDMRSAKANEPLVKEGYPDFKGVSTSDSHYVTTKDGDLDPEGARLAQVADQTATVAAAAPSTDPF